MDEDRANLEFLRRIFRLPSAQEAAVAARKKDAYGVYFKIIEKRFGYPTKSWADDINVPVLIFKLMKDNYGLPPPKAADIVLSYAKYGSKAQAAWRRDPEKYKRFVATLQAYVDRSS
ncbi:unnamed protein product [Phytophthora lilii]|uniref:Unnamed protein product n=1 Tax=Phytophthora lilii TaxID=2077276 RepID=A0A9W6X466_9STRA|nr:unnamed protein product [Phytophthora lilii]